MQLSDLGCLPKATQEFRTEKDWKHFFQKQKHTQLSFHALAFKTRRPCWPAIHPSFSKAVTVGLVTLCMLFHFTPTPCTQLTVLSWLSTGMYAAADVVACSVISMVILIAVPYYCCFFAWPFLWLHLYFLNVLQHQDFLSIWWMTWQSILTKLPRTAIWIKITVLIFDDQYNKRNIFAFTNICWPNCKVFTARFYSGPDVQITSAIFLMNKT